MPPSSLPPALLAAIRQAPSALALLDLDGRHVAASLTWADAHGFDPEALAGSVLTDIAPETRADWDAACSMALDGAPAETPPVRTGERGWLRYSVRPVGPGGMDGGLPVVGFTVHAEDVSTEVEARVRAGRQQSLVEAVTRHAPMIVFALDREGGVRMRAGQGLVALGLDPGADPGGTPLFDPSPEVDTGLRQILRGEPASWRARTADRIFDVSAAPTIGASGEVDGGVGVAIDVTTQVEAERQATLQAEGLRRLVSVVSRPGDLPTLGAALLAEMTAFLGLRGGLLARISDGVYTCLASAAVGGDPGMQPGDTMPLADTFCDLTMEAGDVVAISHMGRSEYVGHRCYAIVGLEAYIGAPVVVDGERVGAISFSSRRPAARPFTDADRDLVRLAAVWAGGLLERDALREVKAGA